MTMSGSPNRVSPLPTLVVAHEDYAMLERQVRAGLAPFTRAITAHSWAWAAGTHGKAVAGPVVLVDLSTPDSLAAYKNKVRGAWVLPRTAYPLWNPDGPPMSADDSIRLADQLRLRSQATADTSAPAVLARRQFGIAGGWLEGACSDDHERVAQSGVAAAHPGGRP